MKKFLIWTAIILLCLTGTALLLLGNHSFQQYLTQSLVERFQKQLPGLEIDSLSFEPFDQRLEVFGIRLEDQDKQPVLAFGQVGMSVKLIPLLKGKVRIHDVRVIEPDIRLEKASGDSPLNLAEYFSSLPPKNSSVQGKEKKKSWFQSISVDTLRIENARLRFDQWDQAPRKGLDFHHLDATLQSRLSLDYAKDGPASLVLDSLSIVESGGWEIPLVRLKSEWEQGRILLRDFRLEMPDSQIESPVLAVSLPSDSHMDSLRLIQPFELTAQLNPKDFRVFWPPLDSLDLPGLNLSLHAEGDARLAEGDILLSSFPNKYLNLDGKWMLSDAFTEQRHLTTDWNRIALGSELPELLSHSGKLSSSLPDFVKDLGELSFTGEASIGHQSAGIDGHLQSDWGRLRMEALWRNDSLLDESHLDAQLSSERFDLSFLSESLGTTAFQAGLQAGQIKGNWSDARLSADFQNTELKDYAYRDIRLQADMNALKKVKAALSVNDPNCRITLHGSGSLGNLPSAELELHTGYADLSALKLLQGGNGNQVSFHLSSQLRGKDLDHLRGRVVIDSLEYARQEERYRLHQMRLTAEDLPGDSTRLSMVSDRAYADIVGHFAWSSLPNDIQYGILERHLPSLLNLKDKKHPSDDRLALKFQLEETNDLSAILGLPVVLTQPTQAEIYFDAPSNRYDLHLYSEGGSFKSFDFENLSVDAHSNADDIQLKMTAQLPSTSDSALLHLNGLIRDDRADLKAEWKGLDISSQGEIQSEIRLSRPNRQGPLQLATVLSSPGMIIGDSEWYMNPSDIQWNDGSLSLRNFSLSHDQQYITADGTISKLPDDSLMLRLQDFSLDDLFMILNAGKQNAKALSLGGLVSGEGNMASLLGTPRIDADLSIDGFTINHSLLGDVEAHSQWNELTRAVELNAVIDPEAEQATGYLEGAFNTQDKILTMDIDAHGVPLDFISFFTEPSLSLGGKAYGHIYVENASATKQIQVIGDALVSKGLVGIGPLNAKFSFDDSIHLDRESIRFHNIAIRDPNGNSGVLNGDIRHNSFKNMRFNLNMDVRNMMVMDIPASTSSNMYGTVYATGTAALTGTDRNMQIDVNAKTEDRSSFAVSFAGNQDNSAGYDYLQFIDRSQLPARDSLSRTTTVVRRRSNQKAPAAMNMNLQLDITPQAEIALVTNSETGDGLRGRGNGRIRVVYGNRGNLALYGRYELENGRYEFSMMDILRRAFNIESGSYINFYGDPMSATMDINASYGISNVSLADLLDESEIAALNLNRTSIPVNCTLNLSGELSQPAIRLGLDFPNADEELQRRILNVINTDEILNRQIVYLMLLNRFAATDLSAASATGNNNMTAVVGATLNTLSTQLNRMIYQALGTDNLSLGFNYRYDDLAAGLGEWQVAMTSQLLDNRLIINGNIGSREDLVNNNTQFIGDFDLEYKFSSSGRWRLKMFNRSNDSRYFKSAMTTQGVGVVYKESFNTLGELRRNYIERLVRQILKSKSESDFNHPERRKIVVDAEGVKK